jgi:hypothetical protein
MAPCIINDDVRVSDVLQLLRKMKKKTASRPKVCINGGTGKQKISQNTKYSAIVL